MNISHAQLSRNDGPCRFGMHSVEGFGKTTTAAYFPGPVFVGPERGIPRDLGFAVPTLQPQTWPQLLDIVHSMTHDAHHYESLVFDTVDWIEPLIYRYVCDRDSKRKTEMNPKGHVLESIEDYGYGKGYLVAEEEFRRLISLLDTLQANREMHVVMLMHSHVKTFKNPAGPDFDRWEPKCHGRIARVIVEWVESLLFGFFRVDASKISEDKERHKMSPDRARAKGISTGERIVGTQQSAMYDAKNRVGLVGEIPLGAPDALVSLMLGEHLGADVKPPEGWARRESRGNRSAAPSNVVNIEQARRSHIEQARQPHAPEREDAWQDTHGHTPRGDERQNARYGRDERTQAMDEGRYADAANAPAPHGRYTPGDTGVPAHHESRQAAEQSARDAAFARARGAEPARSVPTDQLTDIMRDLLAAQKVAAGLGERYAAAVAGWVQKANGDEDKVRAIIKQINAEAAKRAAAANG